METPNLILLMIALAIIFIAIYIPKKKAAIRNKMEEEELFRPDVARQNLDDIFVQLQEFSRESLAKMDTKIRILNQLLQETDQKIAKMESLLSEIKSLKQTETGMRTQDSRLDATSAPSVPDYPLSQQVYDLYDKGVPVVEIAKQTGIDRGEVELIINLRNRTS